VAAAKTRKRQSARKDIWFAAHVVNYFDDGRRTQKSFVVWENVYLISARTGSAARRRAETLGRRECKYSGTLTLNGKPVRMVFGGVRKVVWCAADPFRDDGTVTPEVSSLYDGVEATFSQFIVAGRRNLRALIGGEAVTLTIDDP
jgi:hypothetical protein